MFLALFLPVLLLSRLFSAAEPLRPSQVKLWVTVGAQPFPHIHTYSGSDFVTYRSSNESSKIDVYQAKVLKIPGHAACRLLFTHIHTPL
jgi:hypothetical protein